MLRRILPILLLLITTTAVRAVINDPVLYYTMDNADINGTTITDRGSGGNNGTLVFSPTTGSTGKIGQAFTFNGNYVTSTFASALGDFTVAMWFNDSGTNTAAARLIDKDYVSGFWLGQEADGGTLGRWGGGIRELSPPYGIYAAVSSGWHHIAMTRSGTTQKLYIDGALQASQTCDGSALSTQSLAIAADNTGGNGFKGSIDEVRIYNRALSSTEVTALYNFTGGGTTTLFRRNLNMRPGSRSPILYRFPPPPPSPLQQLTSFLRRIAA